jgi:hypothetical protein
MPEPTQWKTRGGEVIPISELTDDHLINIHFYLLRRIVKKSYEYEAVRFARANSAITMGEADKIRKQIRDDIQRHEIDLVPIREEVENRKL